MRQEPFLRITARYLTDSPDGIAGRTLVLPNKRSALFLKRHIQQLISERGPAPCIMPRFMTVERFISQFSDRPLMPRRERLFLLYDCYRKVLMESCRIHRLPDFDKFIFWGEIILDDFDEIDRQLVDASMIFRNLHNLKEISADYLDDDVKELLSRFWGEPQGIAAATEFWHHIRQDADEDSPQTEFINLWEILGQLYEKYSTELDMRGLQSPGGLYRTAACTIDLMSHDDLSRLNCSFIGCIDFSRSELHILRRLRDCGAATFFWDFATKALDLAADRRLASQITVLKKEFPAPADFDLITVTSLPEVNVFSTPSDVAQARQITPILRSWAERGLIDGLSAINTAIIVPDESLLGPVLLSVPESIPAVNITIGMPFSSTAFASMLKSVIAMQLHARKIHGITHYYYADVIQLISHPHIQTIAPREADELKAYISSTRTFNIDAKDLADRYPALSFIFSPIKTNDDPQVTRDYLTGLIDGLGEALSKCQTDNGAHRLPELQMLEYFRDEINDINRLISLYDIMMSDSTYFSLFERLMRTRRVDLQGTPLRGLQIMGVLETRALDFDNIIILSANDKVLPSKGSVKTMIPNNLRIGYGIPPIDHNETLSTYYFYRLISRASEVALIYDSRSMSLGAGEPSRFIAQLQYLMPADRFKKHNVIFGSDFTSPAGLSVYKTPEIIGRLENFYPGGNSWLSASALKEYKKCRLSFYLKYVRNLRGEDKSDDFITPADYGTIFHKIVEVLYKPYENKLITPEIISGLLDNTEYIDDLISQTIYEIYYSNVRYASVENLPAEGQHTSAIISAYLRRMLSLELEMVRQQPFTYIAGEMNVRGYWRITDSLSVNFKMKIDRVDRLAADHLRFIDYKTGKDTIKKTSCQRVFQRGIDDHDAVFQLLTYCMAYADIKGSAEAIAPVVYPFRVMTADNAIPRTVVDDVIVDDYHVIEDQARPMLMSLIEEIFSPDTPFDQADDTSKCGYCPFSDLCGRSVARN